MNEILAKAVIAAIYAGKEIIKIYNDPSSDFNIEKKDDNSPLTIADKRSHLAIVEVLEQTEYPILSEEGKEILFTERCNWETLWIVDPLDGTKEFIKRNGEFTVNIALVHKGVPTIGVIFVPVTNALYIGSVEEGSYKYIIKEGETLDLNSIMRDCNKLPFLVKKESIVVVASKSHLSQETSDYINRLKEKNNRINLISKGSSLKICMVAEGKADIYPRFAPTMEWDTAAGHAIAKYAGKDIYQVDEETPLHYNKENLLNPWFIVK